MKGPVDLRVRGVGAEERYVDFTDRYRRRESQGLVVVID